MYIKPLGKKQDISNAFVKFQLVDYNSRLPVSILQKLKNITEYPIIHTRGAKRRDWIKRIGLLESNG